MTPTDLGTAVLAATHAVFDERELDHALIPSAADVRKAPVAGHADYTATIALRLARRVGLEPVDLATAIANKLARVRGVAQVAVAEPGFVNIRLDAAVTAEVARVIVTRGACYGSADQAVRLSLSAPGDELVAAIGRDAARYAMARSGGRVDPELWTRASDANPVHLVRFAHARAAMLLRHADDLGVGEEFEPGLLTDPREGDLLRTLAEFPTALATGRPERVARYLEALAHAFHGCYDCDDLRVLPRSGEPATKTHQSRRWLVAATQVALANGLTQLGVAAPQRM